MADLEGQVDEGAVVPLRIWAPPHLVARYGAFSPIAPHLVVRIQAEKVRGWSGGARGGGGRRRWD